MAGSGEYYTFFSNGVGFTTTVSYAYMGIMNTDLTTINDYRLGDGMFPTAAAPWTDAVTTITYRIEKGRYWDCQNPAGSTCT